MWSPEGTSLRICFKLFWILQLPPWIIKKQMYFLAALLKVRSSKNFQNFHNFVTMECFCFLAFPSIVHRARGYSIYCCPMTSGCLPIIFAYAIFIHIKFWTLLSSRSATFICLLDFFLPVLNVSNVFLLCGILHDIRIF